MLKTAPKITYRGLTVVLSNPSRFDNVELLSAKGGGLFRNECLTPAGLNLMSCEVRVKEDRSPLLPGTKGLLLLGKDAFSSWTGDTAHTLGEVRGNPYTIQGLPAIPSYFPQDCADLKDYETKFNNEQQDKDYHEDVGTAGAKDEKRKHGRTSRSNWKFWLQQDTKKIISIMQFGIPPRPFEPNYQLHPDLNEVIGKLNTTTNEDIFLDIETDADLHVTCMALGFVDATIYVIPFVTHNYGQSYNNLPRFLLALYVAMQQNCTVSHNGAAFDWFVLAWKYKIAIGWDVYDTMLAQHRIYPEIEKSLGHCISLWTHEPFHKDESCFNFRTPEQLTQLMRYCGKDVYTMMLIKRAQLAHAARIPGLLDSIRQVNRSVRPYLTMTMQGIHYKEEMRRATMAENDAWMEQYLRMVNILVGKESMRELNRTSKKGLPGSNPKCCEYFHDMLGYDIQGTSKKTGKPSLAKKNLLKLRLKYNNPVIDLCMAYRETAKETGSLKFIEWRDKDGNTPSDETIAASTM